MNETLLVIVVLAAFAASLGAVVWVLTRSLALLISKVSELAGSILYPEQPPPREPVEEEPFGTSEDFYSPPWENFEPPPPPFSPAPGEMPATPLPEEGL